MWLLVRLGGRQQEGVQGRGGGETVRLSLGAAGGAGDGPLGGGTGTFVHRIMLFYIYISIEFFHGSFKVSVS